MGIKLLSILSFVLLNCSNADSNGSETDSVPPDSSFDFVLIKAGDFVMGAADDDREANSSEKPQHKVTISKDFYLSKFELTQKQWQDVMGYSCFDLDRSNSFYNLPGMKERITKPDHPATVSWEDAQKFIAKLNEKEGKNIYRLPTEAEWEYAARAGTTTAYSFGDDKKELDKYAWFGGDFNTGGSHPVGKKLPNSWGLYDMHGNVWEWVHDWYSDTYYAQGPKTDPVGPDRGTDKVVKGGSWHVTSDSWRSSFRKPYVPGYRGISVGFRLVKEIEQN